MYHTYSFLKIKMSFKTYTKCLFLVLTFLIFVLNLVHFQEGKQI